jgi:hypothetical protein
MQRESAASQQAIAQVNQIIQQIIGPGKPPQVIATLGNHNGGASTTNSSGQGVFVAVAFIAPQSQAIQLGVVSPRDVANSGFGGESTSSNHLFDLPALF